jgi:hypothetical protein
MICPILANTKLSSAITVGASRYCPTATPTSETSYNWGEAHISK